MSNNTRPTFSFLLHADEDNINRLPLLSDTLNKSRIDHEIVLYGSAERSVYLKIPASFIDHFEQSDKNVFNCDISTAVLYANKDWLILCDAKTIIENQKNLSSLVEHAKAGNAICQKVATNQFEHIIGRRNISETPILGFRKTYVAHNSLPYFSSTADFIRTLKNIDRTGGVVFMDTFRGNGRFFDDGKVVLQRPNLSVGLKLLNRYFRKCLIAIKEMTNGVRVWMVEQIANVINDISRKKLIYDEQIPVFINCRDRVDPLKPLVQWLEDEGLKNIIFIDNNSSYGPLLEYYKKSPYKVIRLRENIGQKAPWDSGAISVFAHNTPFIVTDPDVIPSNESHGAIKHFMELLNQYPKYRKVGFGLKIDDLPEHYTLRDDVIKWESQFWEKKIVDNVFEADLDTTLALYRPNTPYCIGPAIRTGGKYVARHEPWYLDSNNPSKEMKYYRSHANKVVGTWGLGSGDLADFYKQHTASKG